MVCNLIRARVSPALHLPEQHPRIVQRSVERPCELSDSIDRMSVRRAYIIEAENVGHKQTIELAALQGFSQISPVPAQLVSAPRVERGPASHSLDRRNLQCSVARSRPAPRRQVSRSSHLERVEQNASVLVRGWPLLLKSGRVVDGTNGEATLHLEGGSSHF